MCIAADEGCHEVPEPIAPMDRMFESLDPTRIPISSPDITSNGPMFIEAIPGMPSMPFIPPIAPGDGLAPGIGMLIFCSGEPCGFGEADGICMPGIFICICGGEEGGVADCFGDDKGLAGIFIPGMFIWIWGDAEGEGILSIFGGSAFLRRGRTLRRCIPGIAIPGMFMPGMLPMSCFFAVCFFFPAFLFFLGVAFVLGLGFALLIPGIFDMSRMLRIDYRSAQEERHKQDAGQLDLQFFPSFHNTPLTHKRSRRARPEPAPRSPLDPD